MDGPACLIVKGRMNRPFNLALMSGLGPIAPIAAGAKTCPAISAFCDSPWLGYFTRRWGPIWVPYGR